MGSPWVGKGRRGGEETRRKSETIHRSSGPSEIDDHDIPHTHIKSTRTVLYTFTFKLGLLHREQKIYMYALSVDVLY